MLLVSPVMLLSPQNSMYFKVLSELTLTMALPLMLKGRGVLQSTPLPELDVLHPGGVWVRAVLAQGELVVQALTQVL